MRPGTRQLVSLSCALFAATACMRASSSMADEHADHPMDHSSGAGAQMASESQPSVSVPADANGAAERLAKSPRHAEWATVRTSPTDSVVAWVVYPERRDKAPVVVVVHEIFGLSTWIRGVTDQLAADGFIAIAPDLLTMKRAGNLASEWAADSARAAIRLLRPEDVQRDIDAVARYGMALPAAHKSYGIVGFCWGGSASFNHAVHAPSLGASVVYYGASPASEALTSVKAPVLGLYGANDARVNATIAPADSVMSALKKTYEHFEFAGAAHGFLRQQDGQNGANATATREAWPKTIAWFREHLGK